MTLKISAVGIAWYRQEDYPRILEIMVDADQLPASWEEWLQQANHHVGRLQKDGVVIEKAHIDPDAFVRWCAERRCDVDAKARMAFANEAARRALGTQD